MLFGFIVVIYIGIFTLFNNFTFNTPQARPWILMIEVIMWGLFILIVFLNVKYFNGFDLKFKDILYDLFGTKRTELEVHVHKPASKAWAKDVSNNVINSSINSSNKDISNNCAPSNQIQNQNQIQNSSNTSERPGSINSSHSTISSDENEVFHIPQNKYGYEEASEICKLFDSRLATYDEIEEAYKGGANWCSYGWSSDQLALFPIQKTMYNELKKIPGHERDCGRTGVNGGYMEDKKLKFGVNCYGKKPYAGEDDLEYMKKFSYSNA
jgi:hypothetical protein